MLLLLLRRQRKGSDLLSVKDLLRENRSEATKKVTLAVDDDRSGCSRSGAGRARMRGELFRRACCSHGACDVGTDS